ncbi:MAG: sensor histidine kinase [Limisphaerales bacterium]
MARFPGRLQPALAAALVLVLGVYGAGMYARLGQELERTARIELEFTDTLVRERAAALAGSVLQAFTNSPTRRPTPGALRLALDRRLPPECDGLLMQVSDPAGRSLGRSGNLRQALPLDPATIQLAETASGEVLFFNLDGGEGRRLRTATAAVVEAAAAGRTHAIVQVALPAPDPAARARWFTFGFVMATLLVMALILLAVQWSLARWFRPLRSLAVAADAVDFQGVEPRRLPVPLQEDDLGRLARTINRLVERLAAAQHLQERFVADAAHELGTPLTALYGDIDVTLRRARSPEEYVQVLERSRAELQRLVLLMENLLALAKADAGRASLERIPLDLREVAENVRERLQPRADEAQVTLRLSGLEKAQFDGDPLAIDQVIFNLVDNAIRHTPPGGEVHVSLEKTPDYWRIHVADTGEGIPAAHLPHVFERFYRVDQARARARGGTGLGLAIVKAMIAAHRGTVSATSEPGTGSLFTVSLPRHFWKSTASLALRQVPPGPPTARPAPAAR